MSNNETVQTLSEEDTLKALLAEQANIIDTLLRDNVELIAAVKMFIEFAKSTDSNRDYDIARDAEQVIMIGTNLLDRIAKDHEEKGEQDAA